MSGPQRLVCPAWRRIETARAARKYDVWFPAATTCNPATRHQKVPPMALTAAQIEQARTLTAAIEALTAGCAPPGTDRLAEFTGPFGRTLSAICTYRALSLLAAEGPIEEAKAKTAELIVLYAAGIVEGAGVGISAWPADTPALPSNP